MVVIVMKKIWEKSILVIDDDQGMLRAIDKVLTGAGALVTRAECAGDAVEILTARQKNFDLVITDLRMPFVNGLTVVYAIHKIYPELPVIVLTAFGSADVRAECFRQGAVAFLEKPLDASELLAAVWKVFNAPKGGSGIDSELGDADKGESRVNNPPAEKIRLNARHPMPVQQSSGPVFCAGGAKLGKEQVHEYQLRYC